MPTHLLLGASAGLSDDALSWLADWQNAPEAVFDATDRLVLRYADSLTRDVTVDGALWQALAAWFSEREIFELCFSVGLANLVNRVHATFLTDVDGYTSSRVDKLDLPANIQPEPRG